MFITYQLYILDRPLAYVRYMCVRMYVHKSGPIKSFSGPRTYTLLVSSSVLVHPKQVASTALNLRAFFERGFGAWQCKCGKMEAVRVLAMPIRVKTWNDAQS
jgi:hypothetical protein